MNFTDPQLQLCYEKHFAEACDVSPEFRQVHALIAAHDFFHMLEGPHSPRVHETIWHLLLPTLRPALCRWYRSSGAAKNSTAIALRDHLSRLAGETLENPADIPNNPPEAPDVFLALPKK